MFGGQSMIVNDTCQVVMYRQIPLKIQGRIADFILSFEAVFSFGKLDQHGRALNIGAVGLLPKEVDPFLSSLKRNQITVSVLSEQWLFSRPSVHTTYFQSVENPFVFARKVKEALQTLTVKRLRVPKVDGNSPLCNSFGKIIGGPSTIINQTCSVRLYRNLPARIQGRKAQFPFMFPAVFFSKEDPKEGFINIGLIGVLQSEVNPFVSSLRHNGILVGVLTNHWLFNRPKIHYIRIQSTQPPLLFAQGVRKALHTLKFQQFISF
nr:DUF1259 domain-containing protein [Marininema halotolerans]